MINNLFNIQITKDTAKRGKMHLLSFQNVWSTKPIFGQEPEKHFVVMLTGGLPNPLEN